jgi:glutamate carboxypeptidase
MSTDASEARVAADPVIAAQAREIAERAVESELAALVDVSSPSGDVAGAEAAIEVCVSLLPEGAQVARPECSTPGCAPDLVARLPGTGSGRIVLLGHVDTVIGHDAHQPLRRGGEIREHGSEAGADAQTDGGNRHLAAIALDGREHRGGDLLG